MANDMRLNDKPIAKDGAYIYAEAADGSQVKISKADLAAVVAEQIGIIGGVKPFNLANGETHDTGISQYGLFALTDSTAGKFYVVAYDYYQNGTLVAGDIKLTDTEGYLCLIKTNGGTIKIKNTTGGSHLLTYRMV